MSIDSLLQLGRVEKEFQITKDLRVKLHTLSTLEQQQALASVPASAQQDEIAKFSFLQQSTLIVATDSINGEKLSQEDLKKFYNSIQNAIFQEIFNDYLELAKEQNSIVDELKKK